MNKKRADIGMKAGLIGILTNFLLFLFKIILGISSKSTAIIGDAINNFSDFLSSLITMVGFKISSMPADYEHPYGHARFEIISGFVMSIIMLYLGIDLLRESIMHILNPETLIVSRYMFIILIGSIVAKLILYFYYKFLDKTINSDVIILNIKDSRNDMLITLSIIIGIIIQEFFGYRIDDYLGVVISLFIIYSAYQMIRDFVRELLGARPEEKLISEIQTILDQEDRIVGYHDLIVHSYGPERHYATVHVEINKKMGLMNAHDVIDELETEIQGHLGVDLVIHLDPLDLDNPLLLDLNKKVMVALHEIHEDLDYHDLRLFHNQLIFDVVVGERVSYDDAELLELISDKLEDEPYQLKITFDHHYLLD